MKYAIPILAALLLAPLGFAASAQTSANPPKGEPTSAAEAATQKATKPDAKG